MISRRRLLEWVGLSPVAAPMVAQSATAPTSPWFTALSFCAVGPDDFRMAVDADDECYRSHVHFISEIGDLPGAAVSVQQSEADEIVRLLEQCANRTWAFNKATRPHNAAMSCARTAREVKP